MYEDVEFVCAGNKGRSPLAEAFAKRWLDKREMLNLIRVSSSGTLVHLLTNPDEEELACVLEGFIPEGLERGTITEEQAEAIRQRRNVVKVRDAIFQEVGKREKEQKRIVLGGMRIFVYLDESRQARQTVARSEAELIFPIGEDNYDKVLEIYSQSNLSPKIDLLGAIKDPVFVTLDEYREVVSQVEGSVEEAMEKYISSRR